MDAIVRLMRLLTWQDFELLVDLMFSASGWRRIGVVGRVQKTVDLELILPTTGERAFVQVKSQASNDDLHCRRSRRPWAGGDGTSLTVIRAPRVAQALAVALLLMTTPHLDARADQAPAMTRPLSTGEAPHQCCRLCRKGQPCGDGCISARRSRAALVPPPAGREPSVIPVEAAQVVLT